MTGSAIRFLPAIADQLLLVSLAAVLAFKIGVLRTDLTLREINRLARASYWHSVVFATTLILVLMRALHFDGAWAITSGDVLFWEKLGALMIVGLLSVLPMLKITAWQREVRKFATSTPCADDVLLVQRLLWLEAASLATVLALAAAASRDGGLSLA